MKEISTIELKQLIDSKEKFSLIDSRGIDYYLWEHLPGAINIRWKNVEKLAEKLISNKKSLVVTYCDGFTCSASIRCFKNLLKLGYKNLVEYSGGMADWVANEYETIRDAKHRIAKNVYRFPNQEFYDEAVGSYLIEEKDFILLVDGPQNLTEEHEDFIAYFDKPIKVFMSHAPTAGETEKLQKEYDAKIYLHKKDGDSEWLTVKPDVLFNDEFSFSKNLMVVPTQGHTPGSSSLYDKKNKILFTGDHLEGNEDGEIYDFVRNADSTVGDIDQRLRSAQTLIRLGFEKILPFHYQMIQNKAKKVLLKFLKKHDPSISSGS